MRSGIIKKISMGLLGLCIAFSAAPLSGISALADEANAVAPADPLRIALPEDAKRLVTVEAEGLAAKVSMFGFSEDESGEKNAYLIMTTDSGLIGRKGMGKTVEGDEKTPCGLFKMNTPFGISDALSGFPENYLKVDSGYYWNGDSASLLYNKLVNTSEYNDFNKVKSEHLINYGGYYNYCIDTGYNPEGTPGLGSAIFLHCSMGINTGGCIAIPEADMITVMRNYVEGGTYIVLDTAGNFEKYYAADDAKKATAESESEVTDITDGVSPEKNKSPEAYDTASDMPRIIYAPSAL